MYIFSLNIDENYTKSKLKWGVLHNSKLGINEENIIKQQHLFVNKRHYSVAILFQIIFFNFGDAHFIS